MLRLNFRSARGDSPTLMLAACVRFCSDGTLRGPDNYVIARCHEGAWEVSGRLHRELECEGPVSVRLTMGVRDAPQLLGPFLSLRTAGGLLYAGDACLNVHMPGSTNTGQARCHQLTMVYEGDSGAKA
jgi:hypothetical protein